MPSIEFSTKIRNRSLLSAHFNVVIGELMANRLEAEGIPKSTMRTIPNWADGSLVFPIDHSTIALRTEWGLDDKFVVGYSGNLGRAHEFETFVDAIVLTEGRADRRYRLVVYWRRASLLNR